MNLVYYPQCRYTDHNAYIHIIPHSLARTSHLRISLNDTIYHMKFYCHGKFIAYFWENLEIFSLILFGCWLCHMRYIRTTIHRTEYSSAVWSSDDTVTASFGLKIHAMALFYFETFTESWLLFEIQLLYDILFGEGDWSCDVWIYEEPCNCRRMKNRRKIDWRNILQKTLNVHLNVIYFEVMSVVIWTTDSHNTQNCQSTRAFVGIVIFPRYFVESFWTDFNHVQLMTR